MIQIPRILKRAPPALLPSATKLRRLCFYRCVSVHRGVPGPGGSAPRGCLVSGGMPGPGGGWVGIPACTEADPLPREKQPLMRTIRILLECILVLFWRLTEIYCGNKFGNVLPILSHWET